MQFTARARFLIGWLLMGSVAAAVCSLIWPAAHWGNELLPVGNDSFYHARRILDTAADPSAFYEFDPHIHAPEGSLLVWPWGYDYVMGWIVRLGVLSGLTKDPMAVLVWIPVVAVFASIGLIMLIARRMSLPLWSCVLAAACVALSPLTQYLHGVGFVDHHFAEYIFVLAMVCCGLGWFARPDSRRAATVLGIVLGIAPAIHNAMFVLQIPILLTLLVRWWQDQRMPGPATAAFCTALLASTVAILLPSLPFRSGMFEYYLLSWFHLYVASATALVTIFFCRYRSTKASHAVLAAASLGLLVPLVYQIALVGEFLAAKITRLNLIGEMQSPLSMMAAEGWVRVSSRYSLFLMLIPATYLLCLFKVWQERRSSQLLYWISAVLGISMLLLQFRLHYFGTFAICIPWLCLLQQWLRDQPQHQKPVMLVTTMVVLLMFSLPIRNQLLGPMIVANDPFFLNMRETLGALQQACKKYPGVVLADNDAGHYIRYYTQCSVIADNFLLTAQHDQKIREMEDLLATSAADLLGKAPFVKYVFVRPSGIYLDKNGINYLTRLQGSNTLVADLLVKPHANPPIEPPPEFVRLHEANVVDATNIEIPYVTLYRIVRRSAGDQPHIGLVTPSNNPRQ